MPRGQTVTLPSGTGQLITTLSREEMDSVAILNPNDGIAYVKLNAAANPATPAWDWKVPSQSYAQLPGPWQSLGLWYQDQSGSNAAGQLNVYDSATQIDIPSFVAIGRAAQVAGTQVDITQGTIPQNPPANTSRLWVDGSGTLHLLDSSGNDRVEIDANNIASYVNPLIAATNLGGDLSGPIPNGRVTAHTGPVALDAGVTLTFNGNDANHRIYQSGNVMYFDEYGSFSWRSSSRGLAGTMTLDTNGNLSIGSSLYIANNQWVFFGSGNTNGIISDNTNLYVRTNGTFMVQTTAGSLTNMQAGWLNLGAANNSPNARLAFPQNTTIDICLYDVGGGSCYGIGVESNALAFYSGGANVYWRGNGPTGTLWATLTSGGQLSLTTLTASSVVQTANQFQWTADGAYSFVSGGYIYFRSSTTNGIVIQSTGGSVGGLNCGNINTNSQGITCGALDSQSAWIRSQSGDIYLTTNGDRMHDGGDNNNWVFYGPMGSVNFVFQHRDGSWMGTQAANFQTMSDWKQKLNVVELTDEECLTRLRTPEIPIITWDAHGSMESSPTQRDIGFSAQDMELATPEAVSVDMDGNYFLSYGNLTAVLWGALRLLDQRLTAHENSQHPGRPPYDITSASVAP